MLSATRGSGALKLDYAPQDRYREIADRIKREQEEKERRREAQERARRRQAQQKAQKLKFKLMITGLIMLVFVVCASIVLVHAHISTMTRDIGKLKTEINTLNREIETLAVQVEETVSLDEIMEVAREKLNMGPAKDYQYFSMDMPETKAPQTDEEGEPEEALITSDTTELLRDLLD